MSRFPARAVEVVIKNAIRSKLDSYNPEPSDKPFQVRLLGRDRMALYTFIQSLNTTFGTSIYEPVAKVIAADSFDRVELQAKPPNTMSVGVSNKIGDIVRRLRAADTAPVRSEHSKELRSALVADDERVSFKLTKIDILLQRENKLYLADIKTAKPNKSNFENYKQQLLEWMGAFIEQDSDLDVYPFIAIPYNPYAPEPYRRWTLRGMLDLEHELRVAEEFWEFLGGSGAYEELLNCFERVGIELRSEIDDYFARFT